MSFLYHRIKSTVFELIYGVKNDHNLTYHLVERKQYECMLNVAKHTKTLTDTRHSMDFIDPATRRGSTMQVTFNV